MSKSILAKRIAKVMERNARPMHIKEIASYFWTSLRAPSVGDFTVN